MGRRPGPTERNTEEVRQAFQIAFKRLGWSAKDLAKASGIHITTIDRLLSGKIPTSAAITLLFKVMKFGHDVEGGEMSTEERVLPAPSGR